MIMILLAAIQDPDDREFATGLYEQYQRMMLTIARRYVHDEDVCGDILQDCMVHLIEKLGQLRSMERRTLASYIACTARNRAIDHLRRADRERGRLTPYDTCADPEENGSLSVDELLELARRREALQEALERLSAQQRSLLEGKYILGCTDAELSELVGCKPDSVRMLLTRARRSALDALNAVEGGGQ